MAEFILSKNMPNISHLATPHLKNITLTFDLYHYYIKTELEQKSSITFF